MSTVIKTSRRPAKRRRVSGASALEELRATRSPRVKTFGEIYRHAAGCVDSGLGDLSTNKKYLADFGRD